MISDPYKILGVNQNATDDEIKRAYKEMVKKYHPDKYQNNPLGDLAEEKLQEVNEAYDMIMNNRKKGGGYSAGAGGFGQRGSTSPEYNEVRRNIDMGNLKKAQDMLDNMPNKNNAEWMFLSGMISYKRGWYDDATGKIQQAVSMDPGNQEYQQALGALMNAGRGYQNQAYGRGYRSNDDLLCQACQCYLCADCCCDCI